MGQGPWAMGQGPWAKGHGQGPGPLGVARRADGGPDNGRAAEWAHGGPWAGPMDRAHGPGPNFVRPPVSNRTCLKTIMR